MYTANMKFLREILAQLSALSLKVLLTSVRFTKAVIEMPMRNAKLNFVSLTIIHIIRIMIIILSGNCPSSDIGDSRISPTQGSFCDVPLFGAGTHQVHGCPADILQPVSCENVLLQSPTGGAKPIFSPFPTFCFPTFLFRV